jgi:hypothetical protein
VQIKNDILYTENVIINLKYVYFIECPTSNSTLVFKETRALDKLIVEYHDNERRDKVFRALVNYYGFASEHPCF